MLFVIITVGGFGLAAAFAAALMSGAKAWELWSDQRNRRKQIREAALAALLTFTFFALLTVGIIYGAVKVFA